MCVTSLCTRGALDTWSRGRSTAALCGRRRSSARAIVGVAKEVVVGDLGFLSLTWVITFVPPLLAVWRFVRISRRVFRGVQFPRTVLAGAGLAFGLGGYTLLLVALAGFWGLVAVMAVSVLFAPP